MRFLKKHLLVCIAIPPMISVQAQFTDSAVARQLNRNGQSMGNKTDLSVTDRPPGYKSLIVPGLLMVYGFSSLESGGLKSMNNKVKEEIWLENPHKQNSMDDYLRYAPALAVYGLNAFGVKGRNNFRDRSMIFLLSNAFVSGAVFGVKSLTHELRPDGTDYYSFPSGHTAQAFAAAEFMRREYKEVSPWYGVAGYVAAGATGALRMYNNRHWLSDVMAGAGVGIASTKLAYWLYPAIKKKLFKDKPMNTMIMPFYQNKGAGISMVYHFH